MKLDLHSVEISRFYITEILREINFGDSQSANSAILTHLEALNFALFALIEGCNLPNEQNSQPLKWQKRQFLHFWSPQN